MSAVPEIAGEGCIRVGVTVRDGSVADVKLSSSRPVAACRVFLGRRPEEVVGMAGLLYAVCGRAHAAAALEALEASSGVDDAGPERRAARGLRVLAEMLREHATRLLVDWPARLGHEPQAGAVRELRATATALEALIPAQAMQWCPGATALSLPRRRLADLIGSAECQLAKVLLGNPDAPLTRLQDPQTMPAWRRQADAGLAWLPTAVDRDGLAAVGACRCPPMPVLDPGALSRRLGAGGAERFAARPDWGGTVFETGPLARLWDHPVVAAIRARDGAGLQARLMARIVELAALPQRMRAALTGTLNVVERHAGDDGAALVVLETARGRLAHRAQVADGMVVAYQTLAPTEWNFHPAGPLVAGLRGAAAREPAAARRLAELAAAALDPCVALDVEATVD